jgi:uncharacterized glyoxalase superfamily protein PhnB
MELTPYLNFNGDCREAFEFYAKCLGGTMRRSGRRGSGWSMTGSVPRGW